MIAVVLIGVSVCALGAVLAFLWRPDLPVASLSARWARPPSRFVTLDGMRVHMRDEGPRDDPEPLVLLHGTGSSLHTWEGWTQRLGSTHRLVSLDRPGFGLTGPNPSGDYSMAAYAAFLARLLDQLGVRQCILAGNSSGGRMAWEFAARYPERVGRLILLAPGGYPRTTPLPAGLRIAMSPAGPLLLHLLPKSAVAKSLAGSYGDPARITAEAVERSDDLTRRTGNRAVLGESLRQAQGDDNAARIRKITTSTLILWGTEDNVVPPADAERFHTDIRGSRLVMLPGVGHLAQEEDPERTVATVKAFLAG